jgi:deoxyribodipyrimidine photo-lyase
MVQIVWFKRDLRTVDHRPLFEAAQQGPVVPLYIVEPSYWALGDTSRRQYLALSAAVEELAERLCELGVPLVIRIGETVDILRSLHASQRLTRILSHEETGNSFTYARDRAVRRFAREAGISLDEYPQFGVIRRLADRNNWGHLHRDFMAMPLVPEPSRLIPVPGVASAHMPVPEALGLEYDGCDRPQPGTRASAMRLMDKFFNGRGRDYRKAMSRPLDGTKACSRLSVPLSTGAVSMREVLNRCYAERTGLLRLNSRERPLPVTSIDSLVARLHWHCHFIQKLESQPAIEWQAQHRLFEAARRRTVVDDPMLEAWAKGMTGFPFVDACMRSLIATGWLNFRMRAMVQAFASYHLALDWQMSGTRLARLFTDYEPGIHWPQVQMQSGQTGINTPRIYNPVKQGHDQDPTGQFVRRWVPELAGLPDALIHEPWRLDQESLKAAGIALGETYPARLIDHVEGARAARDRLTAVRHEAAYRSEAQKVYDQHGSRAVQRRSGRSSRRLVKGNSGGGEQLQLFPDP